jgi:hypothetical protein
MRKTTGCHSRARSTEGELQYHFKKEKNFKRGGIAVCGKLLTLADQKRLGDGCFNVSSNY